MRESVVGSEVLDSPLSLKQLKELLHVQPGVVLVGGQALAFWADYYDALGQGFESGLTTDLDFFGTREQAQAHIAQLRAVFPSKLRFEIATIDTPPPSAAVILIDNFSGQSEPMVIDYVTALAGYKIESEARMLKHAVDISVDGMPIKCMHPFDCLKSRIHNLALLPQKRTELGVEQCNTAIRVAREMCVENCKDDWSTQRNIALPMAEGIIELAAHKHSLDARRLYGIDVMSAIVPDVFCKDFQSLRWPQAHAYVEAKYARMLSCYSSRKA